MAMDRLPQSSQICRAVVAFLPNAGAVADPSPEVPSGFSPKQQAIRVGRDRGDIFFPVKKGRVSLVVSYSKNCQGKKHP